MKKENNTKDTCTKKKICFIVSNLITAEAFLKDHIEALSNDFDVYLVANIDQDEIQRVTELSLQSFKSINIQRNIDITNDIKAFISLYRYFREMKFYIVHSVSPKAGFITSLAGFIARVPNRIHIFTGQVWVTKTGIFRLFLMLIDWLIAKLNTIIMIDGESQRRYLINHKIIKEKKSIVIGDGSIAGVNTYRFNPSTSVRNRIREELNINDDKIVFVFLGRLNKDKGIDELINAFEMLIQENHNVYLLLVGIDEENYMSRLTEYPNIIPGKNFHFYGKTTKPEILLQAGDIFCLPTYREGFGLSVIEASCLGLPVICSDTYGVLDAMVDNVTGLRCKVKDVDSLFQQMKVLSSNSKLIQKLGLNGRERVLENFSGKYITNEWVKFYKSI